MARKYSSSFPDDMDDDSLARKLRQAIARGNLNDMREALCQGADPNAKFAQEYYPVCPLAAANRLPRGKHLAAIRILLEFGADPDGPAPQNVAANQGAFFVGDAVAAGDAALVELLLAHGADPHLVRMSTDIYAWFAHGGEPGLPNPCDFDGFAPIACMTGYRNHMPVDGMLACAKLLLDAGADIEAPGVHGASILAEAARHSNGPLVQGLLVLGANPNAVDGVGATPLHCAGSIRAKRSSPDDSSDEALEAEVATFLLQAGARWDAVDREGRRPRDTCGAGARSVIEAAELAAALPFGSTERPAPRL